MKQIPFFYLFVIGAFLLLISPAILSEGMFMDGLIYSTIAHNLANDIGTFWTPRFTETCMPFFDAHPPLSFGIQSVLYSIFGDSRLIEKVYSLSTFILVGWILVKIWNHFGKKNGWLPLFIWLFVPLVSWASGNNMLENTLSVFAILSVWFYLKSQNEFRFLYLVLAGLMLFFGFMTKGFVALFPWSFPFVYYMFTRKTTFVKMVVDTLTLVLIPVLMLGLLLLFSQEAQLYFQKYLDAQVLHSLKKVSSVDSRFFIVKRAFNELIPALIFSVLMLFWGWRKKFDFKKLKMNSKEGLAFLALALSGVLPIMVSMKQSGFYLLPSFPFFALGIAMFISPLVEYLMENHFSNKKGFVVFKGLSILMFISGIILSLVLANTIGRDKSRITDVHELIQVIPAHTIVNIRKSTWEEWDLHGYLYRYNYISIDTVRKNNRDYFLLNQGMTLDSTFYSQYEKMDLTLEKYELYKRR